MKKLMKVMFLLITVSAFAVTGAQAQIIVRVRPVVPREVVVERPAPPSPRHVWVEPGWTVTGGAYVYRAGYWAVPPGRYHRWIPGHWRDTRRGSIWIEGHWR